MLYLYLSQTRSQSFILVTGLPVGKRLLHHHPSVPKQNFTNSHSIRNFSSSTLHRKILSPARSAWKTKAEMSPPSERLQTKPVITCLKTFLISYSLIFWVSLCFHQLCVSLRRLHLHS